MAKHFNIPAAACINKYDLKPEMSDRIRGYCEETGVNLVGMIPYDTAVSKARVEKKIIVEYGGNHRFENIEEYLSMIEKFINKWKKD